MLKKQKVIVFSLLFVTLFVSCAWAQDFSAGFSATVPNGWTASEEDGVVLFQLNGNNYIAAQYMSLADYDGFSSLKELAQEVWQGTEAGWKSQFVEDGYYMFGYGDTELEVVAFFCDNAYVPDMPSGKFIYAQMLAYDEVFNTWLDIVESMTFDDGQGGGGGGQGGGGSGGGQGGGDETTELSSGGGGCNTGTGALMMLLMAAFVLKRR